MPTILSQLRTAFKAALTELYPSHTDVDPSVVPTTNDNFGDYQCNAAMALAKQLKQKPRDVAEALKAKVGLLDGIADRLEIAGPGFINVYLSSAWVDRRLNEVSKDSRLGVDRVEHPQTVVVDYSGPNIAKEMHVGHLRSTIIGDAAARILDFQGQHVIRQNHLGDWGTQFGMLIAFQRTAQDAQHTTDIADLEAFYRAAKKRFDDDPGFQTEARQTVVALQRGDESVLAAWHAIVDATRNHFQPLYGRLHVQLTQEHERGESFYNPFLRQVVDELKRMRLAVESEGAIGVFIDGEKKPPLIIEKTGGGFLYGTTDLAAICYRVNELHAQRVVYFTDSRQAQHFSQVFRTAKQAGWANGVSLEHAPFGTILGKDNKPFKTRSGDTVKLKDLLDEAEERAYAVVQQKNADLPEAQKRAIARAIGIGGVKYADLSKDRTSDYVFDWDQMLAMDGNTAPYLQYAHARIRSIFRKAAESDAAPNSAAPIRLDQPQEIALAKHILRFGEVIDSVARELKPHLLCAYLYDLATKFSAFYEHCPVLKSEEPIRSSRLALADLTARSL
ncbi:MAG: arginine--tRNA ligase, partial [Tepidisphaeraceae bacterium]